MVDSGPPPGRPPMNLLPPLTSCLPHPEVMQAARPSGPGYWVALSLRVASRRRQAPAVAAVGMTMMTTAATRHADKPFRSGYHSAECAVRLQFSPDGKTVSGTAEPGSTITLKDADGNVIGTGKTGSDGKFTIDLGTPLTNGEQITATATDSSGNTSPGTT
ncbi:putative outer membrane adhesin like protein [Enterobacter cloacae]|uniref:Putative outer membrane adhesin like protein n=1 Tax=Enterobacter cloacae TaxID=550 RepID=A0A377LTV0_ENTCL|nr:putative outer membrane adhesin like protein [Enterobacter cloacae]